MQPEDIRSKLLTLLTTIAPDIEPQSVAPDRNFRDQFDFDSMDALHFVQAVSEAFRIDIAEADYPQLANLSGAAALVQRRLQDKASSAQHPV